MHGLKCARLTIEGGRQGLGFGRAPVEGALPNHLFHLQRVGVKACIIGGTPAAPGVRIIRQLKTCMTDIHLHKDCAHVGLSQARQQQCPGVRVIPDTPNEVDAAKTNYMRALADDRTCAHQNCR